MIAQWSEQQVGWPYQQLFTGTDVGAATIASSKRSPDSLHRGPIIQDAADMAPCEHRFFHRGDPRTLDIDHPIVERMC